jgi:hypothetical protein
MKGVCGRNPLRDGALASQPTLSRFENAPKGRELVDMQRVLGQVVINHHMRRLKGDARLITIDLDGTEDPAHGQQAFVFFNAHYDSHCYLPLLGFLTFDDEPEQHLCFARLRPGNAREPRVSMAFLGWVVPKLRRAFPKARVRVRLDAGFAVPHVFAKLERLRVEYVVCIGENARLKRQAEPFLVEARSLTSQTGETVQVFGDIRYAADKWPHERRVVVKAEVALHPGRPPKDNPRYIVTNLRNRPERAYEIYRARGDVENRIKELHHGLQIDRTSCSKFLANQFRVLFAAAAYVLFQALRHVARGTELARAQVCTLRERLLKIGTRVAESARRVVLHFPIAYPWAALWRRIALSIGALPT